MGSLNWIVDWPTAGVASVALEDHFNHVFARAVKDAGLVGLSFHGLRKGAAARLAEAGASASDIQAVTGHRTLGEVTRYTRDADQRRRAARAIGKLK